MSRRSHATAGLVVSMRAETLVFASRHLIAWTVPKLSLTLAWQQQASATAAPITSAPTGSQRVRTCAKTASGIADMTKAQQIAHLARIVRSIGYLANAEKLQSLSKQMEEVEK